MAHRLLGGQVSASPDRAGGLAWQPDRHDGSVSVGGPQVPTEQVGYAVHPRPAQVRHKAGRLTKGKLREPSRHLAGVDWLKPESGRNRYHGQPCHLLCHRQDQVVKLRSAQRRERQAGVGSSADPVLPA